MPTSRYPNLLKVAVLLAPVLLEGCVAEPGEKPVRAVAPEGLGPGIAAWVNGEAISLAELEVRLKPSGKARGDRSLRPAVLQELVVERMVRQAAARYGISISEAELDQAVLISMANGKQHTPGSICEGCTRSRSLADFQEDLKFPLLEAKVFTFYARQGMLQDDPLTEPAIRAYYDAHRDQCRGTYAEDRDKISSMLTGKKRAEDRDQLVRFLFQGSEVIPKSVIGLDGENW